MSRLKTIDGLRGLAAMAVLVYHLDAATRLAFGSWVLPSLARWIVERGYLGVDVFFVLSGFVIPYSVARATPTLGFLGRFALRRSLRLDPPYWTAIVLEVALVWVGLRFALAEVPLPSWSQFWAHFLYLQNITGHGDILPVFWTLCYEIQFYLGFVLLAVAWRALRVTRGVAVAALAALYIASLLGRYEMGLTIPDWFALERWSQFFLGTLTYWLVVGHIGWQPLLGAWLVAAAVVLGAGAAKIGTVVVIATSGLLWYSHRRDGMQTVLGGAAWQFLGRVSYSVYLFHLPIAWRFIRTAGVVVGAGASLVVAGGVFVLGCAVGVASAWALWWLVERPSIQWSKLVKLEPHVGVQTGPVVLSGDHIVAAHLGDRP